ncbi:Spliceosome-Associated Protein Cwc15 [Manis pentadactyla]|nr:Spliceosome-Associated Protein Cwc15 [Manis pentadactyla]
MWSRLPGAFCPRESLAGSRGRKRRKRPPRRELEEKERAAAREKNRDRPTREHTTSSSVSKKPRLDQIPAANLDVDDPLTDVCFVSSIHLLFLPF